MKQRIDYSMPPCRVSFSLPTRSKKMIDELADVNHGSVQKFGRAVFMEGMKKVYPVHYKKLMAMFDECDQKFFSYATSRNSFENIQSEISSLRSEVAALRATITMTTQTGEDLTS